jgi:phenylpyruvate tautomerase PptA (4-oxalocrotonate tautomerase family)
MPILVQVTRGLLTAAGEREIVPRIAAALLEVHGLAGSEFMRKNVIGHLQVLDEGAVYVGGGSQSLAIIEVKVPSVTFQERAAQQRFVQAVTDIVDEAKAGAHPKERTFVSVTHALDGAWGIAGKAYTNLDLGSAIGGVAAG